MKKLYSASLLVFLLFQFTIVQSQIEIPGTEGLLDKLRLNKGIKGEVYVGYSNITGEPYIFENFEKGILILLTGDSLKTDIRYDIYADEIQLRDQNTLFALIHPERVKKILVENTTFIYSSYVNSPEAEPSSDDSSYFLVNTDGKCVLLVKKNMRIQDAEPPKLYQDAKPAKFIPTKDTYYIKLGDKNAIYVKNENALISVFEDKKAELQGFIKQNKLKTNNISDLEKIVTYYNGL
jgi:hypothetical protein